MSKNAPKVVDLTGNVELLSVVSRFDGVIDRKDDNILTYQEIPRDSHVSKAIRKEHYDITVKAKEFEAIY